MKATIEFDDRLYRRLKAEAAMRGHTVKELVTEGVRRVLDEPTQAPLAQDDPVGADAWFGVLRAYAGNAQGSHDLKAIRKSITRGRSEDTPAS